MMMAMAMATAMTILSTYESSTREGGIVAGTSIVGDAVVVEVLGAAVVVRKAGAVPRGNVESWSTGGNVSISI